MMLIAIAINFALGGINIALSIINYRKGNHRVSLFSAFVAGLIIGGAMAMSIDLSTNL